VSVRRGVGILALAALLSGCGDGGSGGGGATGSTPTPTSTATPTPTASNGCSLRSRQDWVLAQMKEWYLFYDTLPNSLDPSGYTNVDDYLDALTATARAQRKDRYFTYLTSIQQETAYYSQGSSAGFGWRLGLDSTGRLYVTEAYESAPALNAGIDRGAEILAIGTSSSNLQTVSSLYNAGGSALSDSLGPSTTGTQRYFQIRDASGTRTVAVTKTDFTLSPVSNRYGVKIITDNGQRYGYVNLRTFITTANDQLRSAFAQFKAAGITNVVVDLRYNGGGLIDTAVVMSNLLGGNRATTDVMSYMTFRPEKASENTTYLFQSEPNAIAATKIAFIGTGSTASASEFVINAFVPYLGANDGLIGGNTYGKPVGQIALDQKSCDDRLRVIAFALQNAARQGAYYNGLASTMVSTCQAGDDISYPMGDAREASTRAALDFLQGKSCTRIAASASASANAGSGTGPLATRTSMLTDVPEREALMPPAERRTPAQREVPGLY
jgi:carboxyl-terminal processing protease